MPTRMRSLVTIFDQAAARHAATLATPAAAAQSAGGSAAATFVAAVRTLIISRFDESVAKHVDARTCLGGNDSRFMGNETNAATIFAKLVPALQEAFTTLWLKTLQFLHLTRLAPRLRPALISLKACRSEIGGAVDGYALLAVRENVKSECSFVEAAARCDEVE
ncbi:hypothetical protein CYMTET_13469 [Cymbomonas tetramitiformis]|uniref:Uncharacterized protein n=1 Tax=Cymbomonas tetramitiformis TaxID=36881 RepID=A0AAE0GID0_9CHLO|nr:hypothetical protein CYMTET_13469 [Cymbomonas tetramitiformis]